MLSEGEFYHIYNRGVDKRKVFMSPAEYKRFLAYLYFLNDTESRRFEYALRTERIWEAEPPKKKLVAIGAYCLMPNHFHLYATPLVEGGISKFMQRLQTAYTMYFNLAHDRSGVLFQGAFKSEHISRDQHARYLFSYIHLNPAKLKEPKWKEVGARDLRALSEYVRLYPYSSIGEYIERKHVVTDPSWFPEFLTTMKDIDEHIDVWLASRPFWEAEPHKSGTGSRVEVRTRKAGI